MSTNSEGHVGLKIPTLPKWCDYNRFSMPQKVVFVGIIRMVLLLISMSLTVAFLVIYKPSLELQIVLGILLVGNLLQMIIVLYAYVIWTGTFQKRRKWILADLTALAIYIISLTTALCMVTVSNVGLIIAMKLIYVAGLVGYRRSMLSIKALNQSIPYQVQT